MSGEFHDGDGCWAIVEILGALRVAGHVTRTRDGEMAVLRVDIPGHGPLWVGGALHVSVDVTTEREAREFAAGMGRPAARHEGGEA